MKYLIDTHALIWWLADRPDLSRRARSLIANPHNDVLVSAVSLYEIAVKAAIGKLDTGVVGALPDLLRQERFQTVEIKPEVALAAGQLAPTHRDPWDRILAMQSITHGWPIITIDPALAALGAKTAW